MAFQKSDLLFLGSHSQTRDGNLTVTFASRLGSADVLILREVLNLFSSQIVTVDGRQSTQCFTDLPFAELAKLSRNDSFPKMQAAIDAAEKAEQERLEALAVIREAEEEVIRAKRAAIEKQRKEQHDRELVEVQAKRKREEEERERWAKERKAQQDREAKELSSAIETVKARRATATGA